MVAGSIMGNSRRNFFNPVMQTVMKKEEPHHKRVMGRGDSSKDPIDVEQ